MQFFLLREDPVHSGTFVLTGEEMSNDPAIAIRDCAARAQDGNRYAIYVYDPIAGSAPLEA